MHDTGTAAIPAFEAAAGSTLPADEMSMPDLLSIGLTQRAIESFGNRLVGYYKTNEKPGISVHLTLSKHFGHINVLQ